MSRLPEVALDVDAFVQSYVPQGLAHWDEVADFVRGAALKYFHRVRPLSRADAQATLREIARLADFQFALTGRVSTGTVFTLVTVLQLDASRAKALRARVNEAAKAAREGVLSDGEITLATQLSRIERIGRALNPGGGWDPKAPSPATWGWRLSTVRPCSCSGSAPGWRACRCWCAPRSATTAARTGS